MTTWIKIVLLAATLLAGKALAASQQPVQGGQDLTGSWRALVIINPGPPICPGSTACTYRALATATSDGTIIQTAGIAGSSPGHGAWKRTAPRSFVSEAQYLLSDGSGVQFAIAISRTTIELDPLGRVGTGTFDVQVLPFVGGPFSYDGSVTFERIEVN